MFLKISTLLFVTALAAAADEKLPVLKVNGEVYSNVTVTAVTPTDIFFTSANGMGNAKLKNLDPELQTHFHYDATKSLQVENKQAQANAAYLKTVLNAAPVPSKPIDDEQQPPAVAAKKIQEALAVGTTFPDFNEMDVTGQPLSIASHKGNVVLIDFWATWCGPCVKELPNVIATYQKHHAQGFDIIGVSLDQDQAKLTQFTKSKDMTWQQFFDGRGWGNKLAVKYGIESIPSTFLLDGDGKIIGKDLRGKALEQAVTSALANK
jgi:peroxiredoxin